MRTLVCAMAAWAYGYVSHAQTAMAFPIKMNVLYIGVDNPVRVMVDGQACKDYRLALSGAEITALGNCQFNIRFAPLTASQTRTAYILDKNSRVVDSVPFRIRTLPDPAADRNNLIRPMPLAATTIYEIIDTLQFSWPVAVLDFKVTRQRGKKLSRPIVNKSARFGPELLALLRTTNSRDIFYFESIRVKAPDGYLRHLNGVTLVCE